MSCREFHEPLNAMLDGELPPAEAAALTLHLAGCPACARHFAELGELRAGLAAILPEQDAPAMLRARIEELLQTPPAVIPLRRRRRRAGALAACAFVLAAALLVALLPRHDESRNLLAVHDAALRASGLTATIVAPPPAVAGYRLATNRMDEVAGHAAEVAQYTRNGDTIVLCIWAAHGEPAHDVVQARYFGMEIDYWNAGGHEYWAASAAQYAGLHEFVAAFAKAS